MKALQQCFARYSHYAHYCSLSGVSNRLRALVVGVRQTRLRSGISLKRFQAVQVIAENQDLFHYSDPRQNRSILPSKEKLQEVEDILG